jgi:citrate lyase subunit beta/citryl-CoA lyase
MRPGWRSLLFVPANAPQRWAKAHTRGADAIIVDLEDSTEADAKAAAREMAREAVQALAANGAEVVVRVNNDPAHLGADLEAVVGAGLGGIVLPKVERPDEVTALDQRLAGLEARAGLPVGTVKVAAVVESPAALEQLSAIADGPRLIALALGSEDFALAMGRPPLPAVLDFACQQVAYAAAARGLMGLGIACGIGNFTDLDAWVREARRAHAMGLTGALAIHPAQIPGLNEAFSPGEADLEEARAILEAWAGRTGGVVSFGGRMLDLPVVERARRLLAQAVNDSGRGTPVTGSGGNTKALDASGRERAQG